MVRPSTVDVTHDEPRAIERTAVRLMALISLDGEQQSRMLVTNVSPEGFQFESPVRFQPGDEVSVTLSAGLSSRARLLYSNGRIHGCKFTAPLSAAAFAKLVEGGPFATQLPIPAPPPHVGIWSGAARTGVILGVAVAGWAGLYGVSQLLF